MTLSGYLYRKSHVINQTAGAGTDYQVPIKVYSGSGSDSGDSVYLNDNAAYFPNDIAFTASDEETLLDYWHERDSDTFWVKIPDNLTSDAATIYIYYGQTWSNVRPTDGAQGYWKRYASNPILTTGGAGAWDQYWVMIHCIIKVGSTYYGYYNGSSDGAQGGPWQIGLATSSDGISWTKYGSDGLILSVGAGGAWDDYSVGSPCVWQEDSTHFYMLYAGRRNITTYSIGLATSSDGITWTKSGSNPVMQHTDSTWDEGNVVPGTRMLREGGTYYLYYWGGDTAWAIGLATSTDRTTWTKSANNPLLEPEAAGTWDDALLEPHVQKFGSTYYMWFQGNATAANVSKIGLASSSAKDSGWTKDASCPVMEPWGVASTWDVDWCECPILMDFTTEWRLYYGGADVGVGNPIQEGYATYEKTGSGADTFLLFDDFRRERIIDTTRWTNSGTFIRNATGIGKYANNTGVNYLLKSVATIAYPCAIEARGGVGSDWSNEYGWNFVLLWDSAWSTSGFLGGHYKDASNNYSQIRKYSGGTSNGVTESIAADTPYRLSLRVASDAQRYVVDGTQKGALAITPPVASTNIILATGRGASSSNYSTNFNWVFVRKWVSTEPAHGAWGEEEDLSPPVSGADWWPFFLRYHGQQ